MSKRNAPFTAKGWKSRKAAKLDPVVKFAGYIECKDPLDKQWKNSPKRYLFYTSIKNCLQNTFELPFRPPNRFSSVAERRSFNKKVETYIVKDLLRGVCTSEEGAPFDGVLRRRGKPAKILEVKRDGYDPVPGIPDRDHIRFCMSLESRGLMASKTDKQYGLAVWRIGSLGKKYILMVYTVRRNNLVKAASQNHSQNKI